MNEISILSSTTLSTSVRLLFHGVSFSKDVEVKVQSDKSASY
jgi:hypothetical protein